MFLTKTERRAIAVTLVLLAAAALWHAHVTGQPPDFTVSAAQEEIVRGGAQVTEERININTASAVELTALDGIGETLAARIVAYREEHGPFRSVGELTRVTGIGEKTLANNLERITVGDTG